MSFAPRIVCDDHPGWACLAAEAWRVAASRVETPAHPGWKPQMCCMPDSGIIWQWDSCLMTFFARYGGGAIPVMNNLDNLYRMQREDGFIGMAYEIASETLAYGERINPPLFAWAEWSYWRFSGDEDRMRSVLPRLVRLFDWIKANRRRASGLYWFEDSGSTGMDNSPRSGYFSQALNGSDICHVDLAAQQALSADCMARMARHLQIPNLAARFEREHAEITGLLNRFHWDERTGFYYDVFSRDCPTDLHNFLNHKSVAGFWPLVAGCCSQHQADALITHLEDPEEFWTAHPVASLSKDDPNFDPKGAYWLGGVWPPINYMLAQALKRSGRRHVARRLAAAHLAAMQAVFESPDFPGIWEAYAPEALAPATKKLSQPASRREPFALDSGTVVKADFVGWSGLGPIAMLIEDILGMDFDGVNRTITWDVRLSARHGLENLRFAGGTVSFSMEEISCAQRRITFSSEVELTLRITGPVGEPVEFKITPGDHFLAVTL